MKREMIVKDYKRGDAEPSLWPCRASGIWLSDHLPEYFLMALDVRTDGAYVALTLIENLLDTQTIERICQRQSAYYGKPLCFLILAANRCNSISWWPWTVANVALSDDPLVHFQHTLEKAPVGIISDALDMYREQTQRQIRESN